MFRLTKHKQALVRAAAARSSVRRQPVTRRLSCLAAGDTLNDVGCAPAVLAAQRWQSSVTTDRDARHGLSARTLPPASSMRGQSTAAAATDCEDRNGTAAKGKQNSSAAAAASSNGFQPTEQRKYEYFENVEITTDGVALVRFDCPGKPVNTISFALGDEAKKLWNTEIESNERVKAVVFLSSKPNMFIAGADIFDLQAVENKQDLVGFIEDNMSFFQRMKSKNIPLVCGIDGPALGGGLEWALWCDYRVCSDSSKVKLGLPEVKLGLLPGFGGTQNLHPLVGLQKAMDMMLTGKDIRPAQAKKMGLVDIVVAPQSVEAVAIRSALELASGKLKPKRKTKSLVNRILEDTSVGQAVVWKQVEKLVQKNTQGNYPAPNAIIQCVKHGLAHPKDKYVNERKQFARLAATPESEALIGIFDGMNQMKKHDYGKDTAINVNQVAVMGAGLMGAGIAQVSAEKGFSVLLKDRNDESVARGVSHIDAAWDKKMKYMTQFQRNINNSNLVGLSDKNQSWKKHFARTDLIIEAIFEDLQLKRDLLAMTEAITPDHCIFATNTSAIPISDIAAGSKRPQNVIGMHYFSPVPKMPLLEIIPHDGTSDTAKATALEVGTKQGKTCIFVKDVPGFYVNRCLGPFLVEVSALVKDGTSLEDLDKSMVKFGMPVGPITLADEVGVDVTSHVAKFLSNADLGTRMHGGDISMMSKMIEKGWLGKKSGQGFYTYNGKKKTLDNRIKKYVNEFVDRRLNLSMEEIQDRMVSRLVNEAAKCLEDDIIANPVVGDIGMVFGTGFAPFRGGPFRYLDHVGVDKYVDKMNRLADQYGPQFEPCQLLKDHAASNRKFHGK